MSDDPKIPEKITIRIMKKWNWHCAYCQKPLFFAPTMKLLDKLNPNCDYYDSHGNESKMLKLLAKRWQSVDHVVPFSKQGQNEESNYVACCMSCNEKYGDKLKDKEPKKLVESKWDGLSGVYPSLLKLMGQKEDKWARLLS